MVDNSEMVSEFDTAGRHWVNADGFLAGLHRVNLFVGGYGSGKSEIAVNFTISLVREGKKVSIADLDIVNPYFRSREARGVLEKEGVEIFLPALTMAASDLPLIQPEVRGALKNSDGLFVLDVGGDPVGARVLASFADVLVPGEYDLFFVLNSRRPFTGTAEEVVQLINEIEIAAGIGVTSLVVNSHLIDETNADIIDEGITLAQEVVRKIGKSIGFVALERRLTKEFDFSRCPYPVLLIDRVLLKPWEIAGKQAPELLKLRGE